jgi:hypothetical protein
VHLVKPPGEVRIAAGVHGGCHDVVSPDHVTLGSGSRGLGERLSKGSWSGTPVSAWRLAISLRLPAVVIQAALPGSEPADPASPEAGPVSALRAGVAGGRDGLAAAAVVARPGDDRGFITSLGFAVPQVARLARAPGDEPQGVPPHFPQVGHRRSTFDSAQRYFRISDLSLPARVTVGESPQVRAAAGCFPHVLRGRDVRKGVRKTWREFHGGASSRWLPSVSGLRRASGPAARGGTAPIPVSGHALRPTGHGWGSLPGSRRSRSPTRRQHGPRLIPSRIA